MSALRETETTLKDAAARYGPSVVGLGRGWGTGTGVVIGPGQVLTVAHALAERPHRGRRRAAQADPANHEVTVTFADGAQRPATIAGLDADLDLAVLRVETADAPVIALDPGIPEAALGQAVIALANPGGRGLRVTHGYVSSAGRSLRGPRGRRIGGAIEHTAPLPRGSSGAPLLDLEGRLLGLSAVRVQSGLILAVALDAAVGERVAALATGQATDRPRLGVAIAPPRAARELRRAVGLPHRDGLLVRGVQEGGSAAAAGVRRGDLIVTLGDTPTREIDDLHAAIEAAGPDAPVSLKLVRGTEELVLEVTIGAAS
jgi:serine protease Do